MPTSAVSGTYFPLGVRRRSSALSASALDTAGKCPDERAACDLELEPDDLAARELVRRRQCEVDPARRRRRREGRRAERAFRQRIARRVLAVHPRVRRGACRRARRRRRLTETSSRAPVTAANDPVDAGGRRTTSAWSGSSTTTASFESAGPSGGCTRTVGIFALTSSATPFTSQPFGAGALRGRDRLASRSAATAGRRLRSARRPCGSRPRGTPRHTAGAASRHGNVRAAGAAARSVTTAVPVAAAAATAALMSMPSRANGFDTGPGLEPRARPVDEQLEVRRRCRDHDRAVRREVAGCHLGREGDEEPLGLDLLEGDGLAGPIEYVSGAIGASNFVPSHGATESITAVPTTSLTVRRPWKSTMSAVDGFVGSPCAGAHLRGAGDRRRRRHRGLDARRHLAHDGRGLQRRRRAPARRTPQPFPPAA